MEVLFWHYLRIPPDELYMETVEQYRYPLLRMQKYEHRQLAYEVWKLAFGEGEAKHEPEPDPSDPVNAARATQMLSSIGINFSKPTPASTPTSPPEPTF